MRVSKYDVQRNIQMPVFGNSADIKKGALMKPGVTAGTDLGALIPATGNNAHSNIIGILEAKNTFATDADTLLNGTVFVPKGVEVVGAGRIVTAEFSLAAADLITCTQAVNSTTMTVTSQETSIDGSFLYVVSGTGLGQSMYITASAAQWTLKAAFGTSLDTSSKFIKILRRFHALASLTSDGTKVSSQAAAGSWKCMILDIYLTRNDRRVQLDPTKHAALNSLNTARGLKFEAEILVRDTAYTLD